MLIKSKLTKISSQGSGYTSISNGVNNNYMLKNLEGLHSVLKLFLGKQSASKAHLIPKKSDSSEPSGKLTFNELFRLWWIKYWIDLLVIIFFVVVAVLYYSQRVGYDKVITNLWGDAPMVTSVFAGRDYRPDFKGDPLLDQAKTTDAYISAAYWYVSFVHRWFDLPYGNAYLTMLAPIVFMHLFGFYVLGCVLCHSRILAILLAFSCLLLIPFESWGELWGLDRDPLNRVAIGALIGFFWAIAVYYGRKPKIRLAVMAAIGLSLWVHPVAIPVLGFSLWLGFWVTRAEDETPHKFIMNMFITAGVFLLILLPYILQYSSSFGHPDSPPELKKNLLEIMRSSYINGYFRNEWTVIKLFFYQFSFKKPFISVAVTALIGTFFIATPKDRRTVLQLGLMALGILLISDILFLLDHYIAARIGRIPLEADLVRGNRFLIPLSFVVLFYSAATFSRRFGLKFGVPVSLGVSAFLFFNLQPNLKDLSVNLKQGYYVLANEGSPSNGPDVEMLNWLREETPRKTSITVFFNGLLDNTVRYVSMRPLRFSFKDPCFFNYFDWEKALEFKQKKSIYNEAIQNQNMKTRFQLAVKTALIFGSELLVIDKALFDESYREVYNAILWENVKYAVIDLGQINGLSIDTERPEFKMFTTRSAYDREVQPCTYYIPDNKSGPYPLIVYLHTWSGNAFNDSYISRMFNLSREHGYAMLAPNFRGINSRQESTGSELAVADILSAIKKLCDKQSINTKQIHLVGVSGGGYMSLLMAGWIPELWKSVTAWCPIFDLAAWSQECERDEKTLYFQYINKSLNMDSKSSINGSYFTRLAQLRSPAGWLKYANGLPIHIFAGIDDGHGKASVPVSHSINAFNVLATPKDRLSGDMTVKIVKDRIIPIELQLDMGKSIYAKEAECYGKYYGTNRKVLIDKVSRNVQLTIFDGTHEMLPEENFKGIMTIDR